MRTSIPVLTSFPELSEVPRTSSSLHLALRYVFQPESLQKKPRDGCGALHPTCGARRGTASQLRQTLPSLALAIRNKPQPSQSLSDYFSCCTCWLPMVVAYMNLPRQSAIPNKKSCKAPEVASRTLAKAEALSLNSGSTFSRSHLVRTSARQGSRQN